MITIKKRLLFISKKSSSRKVIGMKGRKSVRSFESNISGLSCQLLGHFRQRCHFHATKILSSTRTRSTRKHKRNWLFLEAKEENTSCTIYIIMRFNFFNFQLASCALFALFLSQMPSIRRKSSIDFNCGPKGTFSSRIKISLNDSNNQQFQKGGARVK